jgi:molybdate transport system ATP-binding protein
MTVHANIAYGMSDLDTVERTARVGELVELMRLAGLEHRYPRELSGGQKQRTALARTLATGPRVLLLDEPFSALDHQVREKLRGDLLKIHEAYPITTVLVTHDLEEAFMLGTRIAVVNNGRIEQVGTREEVFYRPLTRNVARFMGVKNIFSGVVAEVTERSVSISSPELGVISANLQPGSGLAPGHPVSFCIRPEEIPVIRPERGLDDRVKENLLEGVIERSTGKGSTQVLFLNVGPAAPAVAGRGGAQLKVEVPNFVARKLALAEGGQIRVSLKKESLWVIPRGQRSEEVSDAL